MRIFRRRHLEDEHRRPLKCRVDVFYFVRQAHHWNTSASSEICDEHCLVTFLFGWR